MIQYKDITLNKIQDALGLEHAPPSDGATKKIIEAIKKLRTTRGEVKAVPVCPVCGARHLVWCRGAYRQERDNE